MRWSVLLLLFVAPACSGQVLKISGGDSTLFNSAGADASLFKNNSTTELGFGIVNGHPQLGASFTTKRWGDFWTAGDRPFSFQGGGAGLSLEVRGLTVRHEAKKYRWTLFVGATGLVYSSPFLSTTDAHNFGIGGSYARDITPHLKFASVDLINGGRKTFLQTLSWNQSRYVILASAGLLQNQFVVNGTGQVKWNHFAFTAGHNTYLYSVNNTNYRGNINDVGAFGKWVLGDFRVDSHVSLFSGNSQSGAFTNSSIGENVGAGVRWQWLTVRSDLYLSNLGNSTTTQFREKLSRHWAVSEYVNGSKNGPSVNEGFDYHSNPFDLSVGYETYFYPGIQGKSPFQQALSVSLRLQLKHNATAVVQSVQIPNGATKWTAYAGDYVQVGNESSSTGPAIMKGSSHGKFEYAGLVDTLDGKPFAGAAVMIGKEVVFTDSEGRFFLRTAKPTEATLVVMPDLFTKPGDWETVGDVPTKITAVLEASHDAARTDNMIIHVRRKP